MSDRRSIYSIAVITLLGLVALTWFRGEYDAVAGYDFAVSLKPLDDLRRSMYLWDERLYAGAPNILSTGTIPYFFLQYVFEQAAGSLYRGEMIFFTLILTLPGLTMYYFLRTVFAGNSLCHRVSFFGAIFYMFNTFVVVKWNRGELLTLFAYGTLPYMLTLVEKGLKGPIDIRYLAILVPGLVFFPLSLGHSADFLIVSGIIASFAFWRLLSSFSRPVVLRAVLLLVLASFMSAWWAFPLLGGISSGAANISFTTNELGMVDYYSSWATLLNLMKMWFFSMYPTAVEFNTQFYRPGTLIFPIIAFSALLMKRNGHILFFSVLALAGLWLSKGTAQPFPMIYKWMYQHLPYFFIFRAPSRYFPLIYTLSISILIGWSAANIIERTERFFPGRKIYRLPGVFFLFLVFFHSWPLFSRDAIFRAVGGDRLYPGVFIDIPEYYSGLNSWLKKRDGYFRVHSFNTESYMNYNWGYSSTDLLPKLIEFPQTVRFGQELIFGGSGFHRLIGSMTERFWSWDFKGFEKVLGLMGVRYIIHTEDVMRRYQPDPNAGEILRHELENGDGIKKAASMDKAGSADRAVIYENRYALPHAYASDYAKIAFADAGSISALGRAGFLDGNPVVLFAEGIIDGGLPEGSVDRVIKVFPAKTGMASGLPEATVPVSYLFSARPGDEIRFNADEGRYSIRADLKETSRKRISAFRQDNSQKNGSTEWMPLGAEVSKNEQGAQFRGASSEILAITRIETPFDLEQYPYAEVHLESSPKDYFDAELLLGVDFDDDGWADDDFSVPVIKDGKRFNPDISSALNNRYGFPGKNSYALVWAGIRAARSADASLHKDPSFVVKAMEFYYEVPASGNVKSKGLKMLIDGVERGPGALELKGGARGIKVEGEGGAEALIVMSKENDRSAGTDIPEVRLEKVNPTRYTAEIDGKGLKGFWLVFNESYNKGWKAYIVKEGVNDGWLSGLFQKRGELIKDHHEVNGFANGWWVEGADEGKGLKVLIEFEPQGSFTAGVVTSVFSCACAFLFLPAYRKFSKRRGGKDV